jgi:hypothetical protein
VRRETEGKFRPQKKRSSGPEKSEVDIAEVIRDLSSRLEARTAEAVEMRTRLELTAEAESTLRERVEKLEAKLEAERSAYQQLPKLDVWTGDFSAGAR